jgi:hypothetical protein
MTLVERNRARFDSPGHALVFFVPSAEPPLLCG